MWAGSNKIERIREDGYVVFEINRVNYDQRKIVGFYGLKRYSGNGNFCCVYLDGDEKYNLALIDVFTNEVLFTKKLKRPHRCRVSNSGIVVCEDWVKGSKLYFYNKSG